jgi:hypothetical protein
MKLRDVVVALGLLALTVSSLAIAREPRWTLVVIAALAVTALAARRCPHRHATLQPAIPGAGPDRDHARWYCDQCGHEWAAGISLDRKPRTVFEGYDEQKAMRGAARADAVERQRWRLASRRAVAERRRERPPVPISPARSRPQAVGFQPRAATFPEPAGLKAFNSSRRG